MVELDTFVTMLYVTVDDHCKQHLPPEASCSGAQPSLSRSEVLTLAFLGQWSHFPSERAFYRYALKHLRAAFPTLPARAQFNRLVRHAQPALAQVAVALGWELVDDRQMAYEILDCTAAPTRNAKRRGRGWLPGQIDIGWSNRLGWYAGFCLLDAIAPNGAITGFGFGPASTNDRTLAETLFALRQHPDDRLPSVGQTISGNYLADTGFAGEDCVERWAQTFGAWVSCSPQPGSKKRWPRCLRRWLAHHRQLVETVHNCLLFTFRLDRDRPHDLTGFAARLAAKVGLHNFCLGLNRLLGRPLLAFADLIDW